MCLAGETVVGGVCQTMVSKVARGTSITEQSVGAYRVLRWMLVIHNDEGYEGGQEEPINHLMAMALAVSNLQPRPRREGGREVIPERGTWSLLRSVRLLDVAGSGEALGEAEVDSS